MFTQRADGTLSSKFAAHSGRRVGFGRSRAATPGSLVSSVDFATACRITTPLFMSRRIGELFAIGGLLVDTCAGAALAALGGCSLRRDLNPFPLNDKLPPASILRKFIVCPS